MIVVDIEASGIDYRKYSILSIGAIEFNNPQHQFYGECRIWDGAGIDPESLQVNGFTEEEARDPQKQSLKELMEAFHKWLYECDTADKTIAAQNVSFDRDYLNDSFVRSDINWQFSYRTIDTHSVAYADHIQRNIDIPLKNEHSGLNLNTILNYVGIPREPDPHNALMGAKCQAEVLSRILHGKKLLPDFEQYDIPDFLKR